MSSVISLLLLSLLMQSPDSSKAGKPSEPPAAAAGSSVAGETGGSLLNVRRIYVESFGDDKTSKVLQAMIINSIAESKRFVITENRERADAILKGTAVEKTSQELHASGSGTAAASSVGGVRASSQGLSSSVTGTFGAIGAAIDDSVVATETIDRAAIAVRLLNADGDVIWATTQESKGAKYKGAGADVADKIVKQLLKDLEKAQAR